MPNPLFQTEIAAGQTYTKLRERERETGWWLILNHHLFWEVCHRDGPIQYIISSEDGSSVMSDLQMGNRRDYTGQVGQYYQSQLEQFR